MNQKSNVFEPHRKWLKSWYCGMLLRELPEAKAADCDYCIRKIKQEIKKEKIRSEYE